eukprot:g15985.t1
MLTFSLHSLSVEDRIRSLPRERASLASKAFDWLLENTGPATTQTAYGEFWSARQQFLLAHPAADVRQRKRWLRFIEAEGLECCLWPQLFHRRDQCLTWARQQSTSRQSRGSLQTTLEQRAHAVVGDQDMPEDVTGTKRSYMALVLSSLLDYAMSYELLHFCFDLNLWSSRLEFPIGEALHQVHLLTQLGMNFLTGKNCAKERAKAGHRHQLLQTTREDGTQVPLMSFFRLEFQDGKRRLASQSYHGSGRAHAHQLWFVSRLRRGEDMQALQLQDTVSATLEQEDDHLRGYALATQTDHKAQTPWRVHDGASRFNPESQEYELHHTAEDHARGVRAFFVPLLEATKYHQDVQLDFVGQKNYVAYSAKYTTKFSDSLYEELLNDDADANSIAASILSRYHPCVPEMLLQLFGTMFQQWKVTTWSHGRKAFRPPVPDDPSLPPEVDLYTASAWRRDDMCLLEFLRKTNDQGGVSGEKLVACNMGSRLRDRFYGQWLVLNVPFRNLQEFEVENLLERVPVTDKYLAMCLACEHPVAQSLWTDFAAVDEDMKMEGHGLLHRHMVLDYVKTQGHLVRQYLAGTLDPPAAPAERTEVVQPRSFHFPIQKQYAKQIASGAKTVEGRLHKGQAAEVQVADVLVFGDLRMQVAHRQLFDSFEDMLGAVGYENAMPEAESFEEALETYWRFPGYRRGEAEHGVVAFWLEAAAPNLAEHSKQWNEQQIRWKTLMLEDLRRATTALAAATEGDLDAAREECWHANKIRVLEGPPGTGKTTVAKALVREAVQQGTKVLWTVFTAQLAARMRAELPSDVDVNTCHGALGLDLDVLDCKWNLAPYGLVIIDEFNQLRKEDLAHIDMLREAVDNGIAIGFIGRPLPNGWLRSRAHMAFASLAESSALD